MSGLSRGDVPHWSLSVPIRPHESHLGLPDPTGNLPPTRASQPAPDPKDISVASIRRKSAAVALAVVGVAGLSLASAAQLNVTSGALGAGTSVVASCDSDGVAVAFTPGYAAGGYAATSVALNGIATGCDGQNYRITMTGASGALGTELTGTVSGTSLTATLAGVAAKDVTGVAVVIYG